VNWEPFRFCTYTGWEKVLSSKKWDAVRLHVGEDLSTVQTISDIERFHISYSTNRNSHDSLFSFFKQNNMLVEPSVDKRYSCKDCLVLACCSKMCEKTLNNFNNLNFIEVYTSSEIRCPDCGEYINLGHKWEHDYEGVMHCKRCYHMIIIKANSYNHSWELSRPYPEWIYAKRLER